MEFPIYAGIFKFRNARFLLYQKHFTDIFKQKASPTIHFSGQEVSDTAVILLSKLISEAEEIYSSIKP